MATVTIAPGRTKHQSVSGNTSVPYKLEVEIDFAVATTTKGSALASADVIQAIDIPAGSILLAGGMEVVTAMTGTSTDLTLDFGVTGDDPDVFVDGFDYDGASVGDYATMASGGYLPKLYATADTVDILIASQTGTFTGGKIRCWVVIQNVTAGKAPGIATAGS